MPLKVLLILDSGPGHSESHEFHTEGVKVVYLPPNTTPIFSLRSGSNKDLSGSLHMVLDGKDCRDYGREP